MSYKCTGTLQHPPCLSQHFPMHKNVQKHLLFYFFNALNNSIKSSITKVVKKGKHEYPEKAI